MVGIFLIQAKFCQKQLQSRTHHLTTRNLILGSYVSKELNAQIQPVKWPQLLRAAVGEEQIQSAGTHWTSVSSICSRSAFSSLNATEISPLTITLSNRWPCWFSIVSAKLIMSSKSSSCKKTEHFCQWMKGTGRYFWFPVAVLDCLWVISLTIKQQNKIICIVKVIKHHITNIIAKGSLLPFSAPTCYGPQIVKWQHWNSNSKIQIQIRSFAKLNYKHANLAVIL